MMLVFRNSIKLFNHCSNIIFSARFISKKYTPTLKFADPTYDMTFKMLFGTEKNKDLTLHFLNSLLFSPQKDQIEQQEQIETLEFLETNLDTHHLGHLQSAIDIRCTLSDGKNIMVEMQRQPTIYFLPRTQYYMARAISSSLKDGEGGQHHIKLHDTYLLSICRDTVFTSKYSVLDSRGKPIIFDKFETTVYPVMKQYGIMFPNNKMFWQFFELSKFPGNISKDDKLWETPKYQWLNFLKTCAESTEIPQDYDKHIKKAYQIMEQHTWSAKEKEAYDMAIIASADELDADLIREAGIEVGIKKGLVEGEKKGRIEGQIEIAKKMLLKNESIDKIIEFTGLSSEELQSIQKSASNNYDPTSDTPSGHRGYHTYAYLDNIPAHQACDMESKLTGNSDLNILDTNDLI